MLALVHNGAPPAWTAATRATTVQLRDLIVPVSMLRFFRQKSNCRIVECGDDGSWKGRWPRQQAHVVHGRWQASRRRRWVYFSLLWPN